MKRCPTCNRVYEDSQSFCLDDGTTLATDSGSETTQTQVLPSKRKSKFPLVLIGVLLLAAAVNVGWIIFASRPPSAANQNSKQIVVVQTPTPVFSPIQTPT